MSLFRVPGSQGGSFNSVISVWLNHNIPTVYSEGHVPKYTGGIYRAKVIRYGLKTLPNNRVWFGTNSIPIPDTSVSSLRLQYRRPTLSISSVRPQYQYRKFGTPTKIPRAPEYPTEHNVARRGRFNIYSEDLTLSLSIAS